MVMMLNPQKRLLKLLMPIGGRVSKKRSLYFRGSRMNHVMTQKRSLTVMMMNMNPQLLGMIS